MRSTEPTRSPRSTLSSPGFDVHFVVLERRNGENSWSVGAAPNLELVVGQPVEVSETFISGGRIRLADGRIFKREMTTDELRAALGLDKE